ncbi:MAG: hypothetical protein M3360_05975 [Actinomycetota bacterium]|nr:hypothetical protein [Actinomycetota bacterium]
MSMSRYETLDGRAVPAESVEYQALTDKRLAPDPDDPFGRPWVEVKKNKPALPGNGQSAAGEQDKPQLDAGDQELERISSAAWTALRDSNNPTVRIVRVGGVPSRLQAEDDGAPAVKTLTTLRLRQEMASCADWYRLTKDGSQPAKPPRDVVENMLAQPNIDLPILERIVEAPVFAPDGSIETRPGYHPASRTYYADAGLELKPVSEDPTSAEQEEALGWIDELFGDFPFVSEADRLTAISAMLTPFARSLIDGSTPLHMYEAPTPGTGKGLLADVTAIPATGRRAATITEARNEDEWRKRITAMLRNGRAVTLIDNVTARLDSAALSAALTSPMWTDRILGQSEIVSYPVRTTWLATGNNPAMSREIARRTVRCRMDAGVEHPEDRKGFRHELPGWAYQHRAQLVWALLTITQSWIAGGSKPWSGTPLGSLEDWCRTIGGIFENAGLDQFLKNLDDFRATSDEEGVAWGAFVAAWVAEFGNGEVGAGDLFDIALPLLDLGTGTKQSQQTRLGKLLSGQRDRRYGELIVRRRRIIRGSRMWMLESAHV